jgi:hypothetical protein
MEEAPRRHPSDSLDALRGTLEDALHTLDEYERDPLRRRLLDAFRQMPFEDRAVIVAVFEREVQSRRLAGAAEGVTGRGLHPNPNARLYVRSQEKVAPRRLDADQFMLAMLNVLRVMPMFTTPSLHDDWVAATREALTHMEPAVRAQVARVLTETLALVSAADRDDG